MRSIVNAFTSVCVCGVFLFGCSGLERSEQEKIRKVNAKAEVIFRHEDEKFCSIETPKHQVRDSYSWERVLVGEQPKITKEYFRCRGQGKNPPKSVNNNFYYDCGGYDKHSLPIRENKEYIYPILIELLNHVQTTTHKRVIITCGHRCPAHDRYAQNSKQYFLSKHLIGAEVDFYVEGMESQPEKIISILKQYYEKHEDKDYTSFNSVNHEEVNKEISLRVHQKDEGRDLDNQHSYPYITIQVRYDKGLNKKVICSSSEAMRCYLRW